MSEHALLSASGASRWLACPPSARLEEGLPESTSEYAEEGRLAHAIAELKLRKHFIEPMTARKFNAALKKLQEHPQYQPEMLEHTDRYLEEVQCVAHSFSSRPYVVAEKRVDYAHVAPEGFGTCDCIVIGGDTMHVFDFKYGKGVEVSAECNPQMMLYALGALRIYSILYSIRVVEMHIIQPRIGNFDAWALPADELNAWAEEIRPIARLAYAGEGEFNAGEHCRFCRAKAQCRARARQMLALEEFKQAPAAQLTLSEIGDILFRAQTLAKWVEEMQAFALTQCLAGTEVPGWKAVEGRSVRAWTDQEAAFAALLDSGVEEAMLYERRPLTLAAIEKMLGKKAFDQTVAEFVVSPPGKPTLVPVTDKREAITNQPTPEELFKN